MHVRVKTPAKINLGLEVLGVRNDGFHNIASVMQTISLYDYLDISVSFSEDFKIQLDGNCKDIPYNEKNIVYKAIELFASSVPCLEPFSVNVFIEKNIPVQAGLGGGSANAAGVIWGLNKLLKTNLPIEKIDELCAQLGSDVNVCYHGGTCYAESRGEKVTKIKSSLISGVSIIKPCNLGITAKDGYRMYDTLNFSEKIPSRINELKSAITLGDDLTQFLYNDLEIVPVQKYEILRRIKDVYPHSLMTGSGSAFFVLDSNPDIKLPDKQYLIITGLEFTGTGVCEA